MDQSFAVAVSLDGNSIYVAGVEHGVCGGPLSCQEMYAVIGYSQAGQELWIARPCGGCAIAPEDKILSEIKGLMVSGDGSIYMAGNPRPGLIFYTKKIASDGQLANGYNYASLWYQGVTAAVIDGLGTIRLTGAYGDNGLTIKLTGDLSQVWATPYYGMGAGFHQGNAIAVDALGNTYVAGQTGLSGLSANNDWFTIKYDNDGHEQWVQRYNGPANGEDIATAIAVDASGVYVAGSSTTTNGLIDLVLTKYAEIQNIQLQTNQTVFLQFFGNPGQAYRFQATTNFPNWQTLGTNTANADGLYSFTDTNAPAYPYRFYRTVSP